MTRTWHSTLPDAQPWPARGSRRASAPAGTLARALQQSPLQLAQGAMCALVHASARMRAIGRLCAMVQRKPADAPGQALPSALREGIGQLSGISLDHATVHRQSALPGRIGAHAFAQGSQIHLGPGQERHLPHEAWHLVQQAQGRVRPGPQFQGMAINTDRTLEQEADHMGARAAALGERGARAGHTPLTGLAGQAGDGVVQGFWLSEDGKQSWVNHARKVNALLAPVNADGSGPLGKQAADGVYRVADAVHLPWQALGGLITALGAARMQAIFVTHTGWWGSAQGVAALEAQLPHLARMDLGVLTALFAQPPEGVNALLMRASQADFARLFSGRREQQLSLIHRADYRQLPLPLPAPAPVTAAPAADPHAATVPASASASAATATAGPAPARPDLRTAVHGVLAERLQPGANPQAGSAAFVASLGKKWLAGKLAENVARASADRERSATVLASLALPGVPDGGIFSGVRALVRSAITAGPYEGADVFVQRRPGRASVSGSYTDLAGRRHAGAVRGHFAGQLSGLADAPASQPVTRMFAKGAGKAEAVMHATPGPGAQLHGNIAGAMDLAQGFVSITTANATFEGNGALHGPMDADVAGALTSWRREGEMATFDSGRQIIGDGKHNRAVLAPVRWQQPWSSVQAGAGLVQTMEGRSEGWGHPVGNGGRYSDLHAVLGESQTRQAGTFQPVNLHQIVTHAGAAGRAQRYLRVPGAGEGGPAAIDGALLARRLALSGMVTQLQEAGLLSAAAASLVQARLGPSAPQRNEASAAPDIAYASAPKAGTKYSATIERKKYEFTLDTLRLPANWSGAQFRYEFQLAAQAQAHYVAED